MTNENPEIAFRPSRLLPWLVAAAVLVLYAITLNHWIAGHSSVTMARVLRWDWRPFIGSPLYQLLTWPVHWLGDGARMLFLNAFSAVLGALTIGLLVRSVQLLPHDRTRDQRHRELNEFSLLSVKLSWLPPLIAALLCAFQLTFWENSTAASSEILDLLLFSYVIRCLLEFRVGRNDIWLFKSAFVFGLGIANNWAMIGFFLLYVAALVWQKRLAFFEFKFLTWMTLLGAAGLLLYFIQPILDLGAGQGHIGFMGALKANLALQKGYLFNMPFVQATSLRAHLFMISLTSLVPLILISIRWPSFSGDQSVMGSALTDWMFRVMHLTFLIVGVWVFFDPKFSPRVLGLGFVPFLTFYYLTALVVGYIAGYFLLIFGKEPAKSWERSSAGVVQLKRASLALLMIAFAAAPVALIYFNWPTIRVTNTTVFDRLVADLSRSLPARNGIVLSDDTGLAFLMEGDRLRKGMAPENLVVDTSALTYGDYRQNLRARYPSFSGEIDGSTNELTSEALLQMLANWSAKHELHYLHPSFGYYFEQFYLKPNGLTYRLVPLPAGEIDTPALTSDEIAKNEVFWKEVESSTFPVFQSSKRVLDTQVALSCYSRALNYWGVQMQRLGKLGEAATHFDKAAEANPENVVAKINSEFNKNFLRGNSTRTAGSESTLKDLDEKLGQYRSFDLALRINGPFDDNRYTLAVGELLARGHNLRQSIQHFDRVLTLDPTNFVAQISLVKSYIDLQQPDRALAIFPALLKNPAAQTLTADQKVELLQLEALAHIMKKETAQAEKILVQAQKQDPGNEAILALLVHFYRGTGQTAEGLKVVNSLMQLAPENPWALLNKGALEIQLQHYDAALAPLNRLLEIQTNSLAGTLNRGIALLQLGRYEEASRDYEAAEKISTSPFFSIYFGLGEIAYKRRDKATAIRNYELYLKHAPAGTPEYKNVEQRLRELKGN
jgi:tetratricopeptide (TPR) repeat protein